MTSADTTSPPCAVVSDVSGSVQILNENRTQVSEATRRAPLACGTWMSIGNGFAKLRHRDGFELHFGSGTFFQLTDAGTGPKAVGDQIVLYRGQIYANSESGSSELRLLTANGRARLKQGSLVLVYNREQQETQLIAVSHEALLENRFDPAAKLTVKEGEASSLNLELQRVVPTASRAIAVAALRGMLKNLHVNEREVTRAARIAVGRHERKIASQIEELGERPKAKLSESGRPENYERHKADAVDEALHRRMASRVTGGAEISTSEHNPSKGKKHGHHGVQVEVQDQEGQRKPAHENSESQLKEDAEKRRILEELTKIKEE